MFKISGKVSPMFGNYIFYTSLCNVISGVESVLSSYSMLDATGVGKYGEEAVSLAAVSLNLMGKDIVGQIVSVPVTAMVSKMGDKDPVKYAKLNVFIFGTSTLLEYITPLVPSQYFILLAASGNIGKNIAFNGLGAFNANAINNISIDKTNISELYSKITSVVQLSYSFGMILGLTIIKYIPCYYTRMGLLPFLSIGRYLCMINSIKGIIKK